MQKITLLQVGRPKTAWIVEGLEQFSKRLRFAYDLRVIEVQPGKSPDAEKQRQEESEKVLEHIEKLPGKKILLDEQGDAASSKEFSLMLEKAKDSGTTLVFIIGGSFGFTDEVRTKVDAMLKLSDMTFTHEISALVLIEQLYRAAEIAKGSGYHH